MKSAGVKVVDAADAADVGEPFESGVKRFYLRASIESACPECGESVKQDFEDEYLSYPVLNAPFEHVMCCSKDHEWRVDLLLECRLKVATVCEGGG